MSDCFGQWGAEVDRFAELEAFVRVAADHSFTRAADRLDVAKTVVSDRVARLERRLGVQLLRRTTRRLTVTDVGETFLVRAQRLLDDLVEAETEAQAAHAGVTGRLKVAAPLSFGVHQLGPVVAEFMAAHPAVAVEIELDDRRVDLVAEGVDVGLRIGGLNDSTLVTRRLARIRHVAAASPAFWNNNRRPNVPADLAVLPALTYTAAPRNWRVKTPAGSVQTVPLNPRLTSSNGDVLRDAALAGLGFVIEPSFIIGEAVRRGTLEAVLTDHSWSKIHLHALWVPTRQLSTRLRTFVDFLAASFAGLTPPWDVGLRFVD